MELIAKRFLLRDFIEDDLPDFVKYHDDPRSFEFYDLEEAKPNHARELFQIFKTWSLENPRRNYQLAIIDRRNLKLIGCCGLRRASYDSERAEMGIELAPQFWSRYGYAIEVGKALIEFGFCDLGLKEIRGISVSANLRVARLARRYGFIEIGDRSSSNWMSDRGWSQIEWQLTRESWHLLAERRFI